MPGINLDRLLNEPIYAWDFRCMIGDVEDFLNFSECNIDWQFHRELQHINHRAEAEGFPEDYKKHLETNAEHRFKVSLPLRVRYGAVIALNTSVEWTVGFLGDHLQSPLSKPKRCNKTVHGLHELQRLTGAGAANTVLDYEALVRVRNCIVHSAGIEKRYEHRNELAKAVDRLAGFSLGNWHFLGRHVCIEKAALNPYVQQMADLIFAIHTAADQKGLLRNDAYRHHQVPTAQNPRGG